MNYIDHFMKICHWTIVQVFNKIMVKRGAERQIILTKCKNFSICM